MSLEGGIERELPCGKGLLRSTVVDAVRRQVGDPTVAVLGVVPREEGPAESGANLYVNDSLNRRVQRFSNLVPVDIKPGSDPNSINPKKKGVVPVAILTTDDFDAWDVDASTLAFGPNGAVISHVTGHAEDVDSDGDIDLVVHFSTPDTGIACGDTEATLTGQTVGGQAFEGTNAIKTPGCK